MEMMLHPAIPLQPYAAIREEIHSGDLLLCQGRSPMSRMIQAATHSPWSHVGVLWRLTGVDRILVLESVESIGVRAVPVSQYVTDYNHTGKAYPGVVCIGRHSAFPSEVLPQVLFAQDVIDLLGTNYDRQEIVAIALRIVAHKLGLPPQPVRHNALLICSEFAQIPFARLGIQIQGDARGFITPQNWAECPEVHILWQLTVAEHLKA